AAERGMSGEREARRSAWRQLQSDVGLTRGGEPRRGNDRCGTSGARGALRARDPSRPGFLIPALVPGSAEGNEEGGGPWLVSPRTAVCSCGATHATTSSARPAA